MAGFPLGWGEWVDRLGPSGDGCPVSASGIEIYLKISEEFYSRDERRYQFSAPMQIMRHEAAPHTLWLWRCDDTLGRTWYVVVGAGLGEAARNSAHRTRWLFAESSEGRSLDEFLEDAIAELFRGEEAP